MARALAMELAKAISALKGPQGKSLGAPKGILDAVLVGADLGLTFEEF